MKAFIVLVIGMAAIAHAQIPEYSITMTAADYELLFTRDIFDDTYLPATFTGPEGTWSNASTRFKGHSTRYFPKKSYRVRFASSNLFLNRAQINFNSMYTDKSFLREKLAWDLFSDINALAPRGYHAALSMNGEQKGLYLFIDKVDRYFLQNRSRTVAPTYEASDTYTQSDLTIQPDSILKRYYEKAVGSASDYSDLAAMIQAINVAPDASFADTVDKYFDVSSILNWFGCNTLVMMEDSYVKNYFLYRDTSRAAQQWTVIPWDYDLSFGRTGDLAIPYPASLLNDGFAYTFPPLEGPPNVLRDRFMETPALRERLRGYVDTLLQTVFTEEHLYPRIDSLAALIETHVVRDPEKWGTLDDFHDHVEALKYFVTARRNYLLKTFINAPDGDYDMATLPVSQVGVPYHFVAYDGRQIGTCWLLANQGLDSLTIRVHPDSTPPYVFDAPAEEYVRRWVEIIPHPANATFSANFQWMYKDVSSTDREVGAGIQDERLLKCYAYDGAGWKELPAAVNPFANTVTVNSITDADCGVGKYMAAMVAPSYAQQWFRQPLYYWQRWHDVRFRDGQNGYIVGEHGTLLRTSDGGLTWTQDSIGINLSFRSIAIPSVNIMYVAGDNGSLYSSSDQGFNWTQVDLGISKHLKGVAFISAQLGWVFGKGGQLWSTTNGGSSWSTVPIDTAIAINALTAVDDRRFTVYREDGTILRTVNAGSSWQIPYASSRSLNAAASLGSLTWVVGDSGTVLISTNAGGSWSRRDIPSFAHLEDVFPMGSSKTYVAGERGALFYTTDNGVTWFRQYNADSHDLFGLAFLDSTHGIAVGNGGVILTTTSAGTVTSVPPPGSQLPSEFLLHQNFPNPFNPSTVIRYELPRRADVRLSVYDVLGREVATLANGVQEVGRKEVEWNSMGKSSGVYFYRLSMEPLDGSGKVSMTRKMLIVR